jgi:hypothetical protein
MTIEIIEKQIAQTRDRLDRAVAQIEAVAAEFKRHCYEWHVNQNKQSQTQIGQLRQERQRLVEEQEMLAGALAGLEQRKADARDAVARTDASERRKRIEQLLVALAECAAPLDVSWGRIETGQAGGFIHRVGSKNPPLFEKAGTLVAEIVVELRALRLDRGVAWPSPTAGRGFGIGTCEDLRRAFETAVKQYAPARLPGSRSRNFVGLIEALASGIRAAMKEHEATTEIAA